MSENEETTNYIKQLESRIDKLECTVATLNKDVKDLDKLVNKYINAIHKMHKNDLNHLNERIDMLSKLNDEAHDRIFNSLENIHNDT